MSWPLPDWLATSFDDAWPDAPTDAEAYLLAAYSQCVAFAPAAPDEATSAEDDYAAAMYRFRLATVMQARALYRSSTAGGGDTYGAEGITVSVFPMDWTVKALLRPAGRPVVA